MKEKMLPQIWEAISGSLWVAISVIALFAVISFMWGREKQVLWWLKHNLLFWNRNNYKDVLGDHIRKINSFSNSPGLHTEILSAICEISGATDASLLLGSDFNSFQVKASVGSSPMSFVVEELEAFLKWLSEQRGVITKEYIDNQPVQNGLNHIRIRYFVQFHAEVCVPLFLNKQLIGVINLGQRRFGDYEKNVCDLVMILCEYCAALLQNRELLETVRSDGLKIKQVDQLRNQLISNMSHEFRTPLNSIIGLAELIVEGGDGEVNEEQIKHLSMISQSGKRLLMAVSSMLDLAKIQSNKLTLKVRRINISKLVCDIAQEIKVNSYTKLCVDFKQDIPVVYGDENKIAQILKQLLENAAKFTRSGKITINAEKTGDMLKICVSDTGIGIDPEHHKIIFDGFRQVDGGLDRQHEGPGLGLTLTKKIVELHGGRIWLNSKRGRGANFYFTLPTRPTALKHHEIIH